MNTHDIDIELPPLPFVGGLSTPDYEKAMHEWCYAAIEADRKRQGEVVVTKTPEGEIIAVTRQDDEGKILSVIAEADRQRRDNDQQPFGYFRPEPFGWTDCAATDEGAIALYERPQARGEPVGYVMPTAIKQLKSGGNAIVGGVSQGGDVAVYLAPQPAEPVKEQP